MATVDEALQQAEADAKAGVDAALAEKLRGRPWDAMDEVVVEEIVVENQVTFDDDAFQDDGRESIWWSWPVRAAAVRRAVGKGTPQARYVHRTSKTTTTTGRLDDDDDDDPSESSESASNKAPVVGDAGRPPAVYDGLPGANWRWLGGWRALTWRSEPDVAKVGADRGKRGRRREWTRTRALVAPPSSDCVVAAKLLDMRTKLAGLELLAAKLADQLVVAKLELDRANSNAAERKDLETAADQINQRLTKAEEDRQDLQQRANAMTTPSAPSPSEDPPVADEPGVGSDHAAASQLPEKQLPPEEQGEAEQSDKEPPAPEVGEEAPPSQQEAPPPSRKEDPPAKVVVVVQSPPPEASEEPDPVVDGGAVDGVASAMNTSDDVLGAVDDVLASYEQDTPEERPAPAVTVVHVVPVPTPRVEDDEDTE